MMIIFQDAFGGNSLTLIVCCVSPQSEDYNCTFTTLKYGGMARYILNEPSINTVHAEDIISSQASLTSTPYSNQTFQEVINIYFFF